MLNGTMELAMSMTGASQTAIEGSALAVTSADCLADEDYYAIISEVMDNANPFEGLKMIAIDADSGVIMADPGDKIKLDVYAIYDKGLPKLLSYDPEGKNGYKYSNDFETGYSVNSKGVITVGSVDQEVFTDLNATGVGSFSDLVTIKIND